MRRFRKLSKSWIVSFHGFHWKSRLRMLIDICSKILINCNNLKYFILLSFNFFFSRQYDERVCKLVSQLVVYYYYYSYTSWHSVVVWDVCVCTSLCVWACMHSCMSIRERWLKKKMEWETCARTYVPSREYTGGSLGASVSTRSKVSMASS